MARAKKTDQNNGDAKAAAPVQEVQEQTENSTITQEQGQGGQQDTPEKNTTGDGGKAQSGQNAAERDLFAGIPNPCVYCGPTVRGVARQYTTYQGGIPDTLRDFIREHPEARRLIVSTAQFPSLRKRLDTPGTAAAKLYKQIKGQL